MNEQRAFTVVVTGCKDCPLERNAGCSKSKTKPYGTLQSNYEAITPSCPMYKQSYLKDETK